MSTTTSSRVESKTAQKTVNKPGQHRHLTRFLSRKLPQHTDTASERAKSSEPLLATAQPYSFTTPCAPPSHHVCERACVLRLGHFCNPLAFPPSRALSPYLLRSPLLLYFALLSRIVLRFFFQSYFLPPSPFFLHKKNLYTLRNVAAVKNSRKNTSTHTTTQPLPRRALKGGHFL